ncbi:MAG: FGGY-family carbohydrate kinase [Actinobacteria bacterium]|nr:FGGY-family carbohydrate kinase [Actinomycetota bacterium]
MGDKFIVSHDVGTGGSKAVLTDLAGGIIASSFEPYPVSYPQPHWAEQDPRDWWKAVAVSTQRVIKESKIKAGQVIGTGFATQMLGVLPVNESGEPLRPAIIWIDSRADEQAARLVRRLGGSRVIMTVAGAVPSGKDVICKILWLKEKEPQVFADTHKILDVNGYLVCRATGNMIIDHTGAGVTGFLKNKTRDWDPLFAKLLGIPLEKMPDVKSSIEVVGLLTKEAAAEMGLEPGTPVIGGMGDVPAAATGSGALENGDAHIYLGTSGWLCISTSKVKNLGKNGIVSVVSADPEMFIMIGETETAGACLKWFADNFATAEEMERARQAGDEMAIFPILDEVVEKVEPGAKRLLFTPWMFGERAPITDTTLRAAFVNLSLEHERDHLLRAVYEGVAYNCRWLVDAAGKAGFKCGTLRTIGGGARSDVWMQIMADVTRRKVEAVETPQEAGAMGCALAVAVALKEYESYRELKKVVKVRGTFEPNPDCCTEYDELYGVFRCLHGNLTGICRTLNEPGQACKV